MKNSVQDDPKQENFDLDETRLLGFEQIQTSKDGSTSTEDKIALAFNTRGETVPVSDRRLKTDIEPIGETAHGLTLYRFRYIGDDRKFEGLMAQDLLAHDSLRDAAEQTDSGYYRVNYARLGLEALVTAEMRVVGEQALARALAR